MNWIIPMAGKGVRTQDLGKFKPFIRVCKRTVLEWLLWSIRPHLEVGDRIVFVTTLAYELEFGVKEGIEKLFDGFAVEVSYEVVLAEDTPSGPAASVSLARGVLSGEVGPVTVVNVDQYIHFDLPPRGLKGKYGYLALYAEFSEKSSYVRMVDGLIVEVVEKKNISNLASSGVYGFDSVETLFEGLDELFEADLRVNGEFYVGPAFNYLIEKGISVYPTRTHVKFDLGSLNGIAAFSNYMALMDSSAKKVSTDLH